MSYGWGWDLPPGTPRPHGVEIEVQCVNPDCTEFLEVEMLDGTWELGMTSLDDEAELPCKNCGWYMEGDLYEKFPVVDTGKEGNVFVLVDLTEGEAVLIGPQHLVQQARQGFADKYRIERERKVRGEHQ